MTGGRTDKGLLLLRVRQAEGPLRAVRFLAAPWQQPANTDRLWRHQFHRESSASSIQRW